MRRRRSPDRNEPPGPLDTNEPLAHATCALFALEEYRALRAEGVAARDAQHQILQWSVAGLAVLLGAAVALVGTDDPARLAAACLVFGLAFPGALISASLVWMNEVFRIERASLYLRWREAQLAKAALAGSGLWPPLHWETWLTRNADGSSPDRPAGKSNLGAGGVIAIFVGGLIISSALLIATVGLSPAEISVLGSQQIAVVAATAYGMIVVVAHVAVLARISQRIKRISRIRPPADAAP